MATGFRNTRQIIDAELSGAHKFSGWRKTPVQATGAGIWFDISMSPGNPSPQYYASAPLTAQTLSYSTDGGINHGLGVSSDNTKVLRRFMGICSSATPLPMPMMLMDYLMFYPFIDEGTTDTQLMTNIQTLPRYTDGKGVMIMPVLVAAGSGGAGVTFTCSYTNQAGVSGRTTRQVALGPQIVTGTIATSSQANVNAYGPFLGLEGSDSGVRSIESITFNGATDVGLITLVLVKPIAQMSIRGVDAPVEIDYLIDFSSLPEIQNNAYLNFICCPNGSLSGVSLLGTIDTIWKD